MRSESFASYYVDQKSSFSPQMYLLALLHGMNDSDHVDMNPGTADLKREASAETVSDVYKKNFENFTKPFCD